MEETKERRVGVVAWGILALLFCGVGFLCWLAPNERTLGAGIKIVYVHVAAMWVGLTGFAVAAALGLWLVASGRMSGLRLTRLVLWTGFGWFFVGVTTSLLAASINWGGVYWAEPRMAMSLRFLMVTLPLATLALWVRRPRLLGSLALIPPLFLWWSLWRTPLILHPRNPIQSATSQAIQSGFVGMYLLCLGVAAWLVWWGWRFFPSIPRAASEL